MAEEQDIKQETVEETEDTTNVEEPTVEKTEEAVADAAQVLEELKADFDNRYKRLQADFENFKRRTNQEKEQLAGYVKGDVLTDLLPVLDNFERAVQSPAEGEAKLFLVFLVSCVDKDHELGNGCVEFHRLDLLCDRFNGFVINLVKSAIVFRNDFFTCNQTVNTVKEFTASFQTFFRPSD